VIGLKRNACSGGTDIISATIILAGCVVYATLTFMDTLSQYGLLAMSREEGI